MADGEGGREAFCLLLWRSTGGRVTLDKKIVQALDQEGEVESYARGYCTRPWDCYQCPLMQEEIAQHPPGETAWVCPSCLSAISKTVKERGYRLTLPGHFTEGQCQYKDCDRPAHLENGVEIPARFSRFLQLVIGPID